MVDYVDAVQQVRLFMRGRHHELLEQIKSRMKDASVKLEFEKAAMLRDQARALGRIFEKQTDLDAKGNARVPHRDAGQVGQLSRDSMRKKRHTVQVDPAGPRPW